MTMEGLQNLIRSSSKDPKSDFPSFFSEICYNLRGGGGGGGGGGGESVGLSAGLSSADNSRVLINRQLVSLWTCSKLCAMCFVAGIIVGYTLKRRVRRWVSRLLKRLKDD